MMIAALVGTLTLSFIDWPRTAASFALGAALGILNYFWLREAVKTLLAAGHASVPRRLVIKLVVRYPLTFAGIYVFYHTGWLPFLAILGGLFVPVGGVLMEAIFQIREGWQ
jgi:hypothetical protein